VQETRDEYGSSLFQKHDPGHLSPWYTGVRRSLIFGELISQISSLIIIPTSSLCKKTILRTPSLRPSRELSQTQFLNVICTLVPCHFASGQLQRAYASVESIGDLMSIRCVTLSQSCNVNVDVLLSSGGNWCFPHHCRVIVVVGSTSPPQLL
jgi:hypothetical protein